MKVLLSQLLRPFIEVLISALLVKTIFHDQRRNFGVKLIGCVVLVLGFSPCLEKPPTCLCMLSPVPDGALPRFYGPFCPHAVSQGLPCL